MAKKSALGRGLGALIEDGAELKAKNKNTDLTKEIDLSKIESNPFQPRTRFNQESIEELAQSIRLLGIVQPVTLRKISNDKYQLIAGERRVKASKLAGLEKVPAYIREANDDAMLELALVENIQREDLDSIEIAISYQRLIEECSLTHENLSERVGKKRSTISNYLRLLKLPAEIQLGLRNKQVSMGHARAIVNVEDAEKQIDIYNKTIQNDYSVRKVEEIVRSLNNADADKAKDSKTGLSEEYVGLKNHLSNFFSAKVDMKRSKNGKGKIIIPFISDDDLERILGILDQMNS
ncbi:MAG: ParB/RepB/Spo0J family partition protein [Marinifilaceae bacterium]|jgi:ParB family chromosome partitioning protein|nr:ParB/RepB/Spo0J family partition protein [Marinifilaceae bacterium]